MASWIGVWLPRQCCCVCLRASVICKLTAVDRLPVDLCVYVFGASLNSLLVRGRGVSAYYARRDPLSTNELAGLEALLDTVLSC